jgi:hypothetical protein
VGGKTVIHFELLLLLTAAVPIIRIITIDTIVFYVLLLGTVMYVASYDMMYTVCMYIIGLAS